MAEPAPIMPRLSAVERRVLHGVGFVAASRIHDDRLDMVIDCLRRDLQAMVVRADTEALQAAAKSICASFKRRTMAGGAVDWMAANIDASRVSQAFHWLALCSLDGV